MVLWCGVVVVSVVGVAAALAGVATDVLVAAAAMLLVLLLFLWPIRKNPLLGLRLRLV